MPSLLTSQAKLIGSLKFDPGYLLLIDYLQSKLDDLTEDLADPNLTSEAANNRLRYWQAFREILSTLKVLPANYFAEAEAEEPSSHPMDTPWLVRAGRLLEEDLEEELSQ